MKKWGVGLVVLLILMLLLRQCIHKQKTTVEQQMSTELKENESAKVTVDVRTGVVTEVHRNSGTGFSASRSKRGETTSRLITPSVRRISITVGADGTPRIWAQDRGFVFEPGVVAGFERRSGIVGLDDRFYFRQKLGLNIGIATDQTWRVSIYGAVSYDVWRNTSVFAGLSHRKDFVVGLRIGF